MKALNLIFAAIILCLLTSNTLMSQYLSEGPFNFEDYVRNIPHVDDHDNVYAIDGRYFYSLSLKGKEKWKYVSEQESIYPESLCTTADGRILFATYDENVHCIDTSGNHLWSFKTRDLSKRYRDGCHIVPSENNRFVVTSADSFLYVLNSSGELLWNKQFNFPFANHAAVYEDSIIYCGAHRDTVFYAIDFDGNNLWEHHVGGERVIKKTPVVNSKGEVCMYSINNYSGAVRILDKKGDLVFEAYDDLLSDPYFDPQDNLYYSEKSWFLYMTCFDNSGNEKWKVNTDGYVYSSPRLGPDGNLYFGSDDGYVFCLDTLDGTEIYKYRFNAEIRYPVDFSSDGTIFCLVGHPAPFSLMGALKSISNPKPPEWMVENTNFTKAPAISDNGIIIVNSIDSVYAFNQEGQEIWNYDNEGDTLEVPVIFENTVFVASRNMLTALNLEDGSLIWKKPANGQYNDAPAIGLDKSVYIGSTDKNLSAYTAGGELIWSYSAEGPIIHSPAVTSFGNVIFTCNSGMLYSLDSKGTLRFKSELRAFNDLAIYTSCHCPTIDGYGNIYIGTVRNADKISALFSFSPRGDINWKRSFDINKIYPPSFDKDNNLYFGVGRTVRSLDLAGNQRYVDNSDNEEWKINLPGEYSMGNPNPTVDESGNVYIGSGTGNIYKISSACELNWVYNNSDNELLPSSVFIGDTGSCFFTADGKLHHLIGQAESTAVYNKSRSDNGNTNLYYTIDISGTKNIPHQFEVQIFPNPAEDHLVLTWKNSSESMTLFLYDIQGRLVYENQVINGEPVLLDQLNSGIYIVQLFNAKEFIYSEKIVLH